MTLNLWILEVTLRWPSVHIRKHRHRHKERGVKLEILGKEGGGTVHATFRRKTHHHEDDHHKEHDHE